MPNLDGTVQVAPPTQSAFAPQAGAPPPPPQAAAPVHSQGTDPGFGAAILALLKGLVSSAAPPQLTQHQPRMDQAIEDQSNGSPPAPLGNHF